MATTNLGKVSVTPKGEYDPLITYERLDIISHNGSSYIVKQASTGVTPIDGEFYALIAEKGDGGSFVKKAYKTYAAMDADKVNIPANSSVDVTNDPDESKNGAYIYDGVAFTRSQYDSKVVTDKIIADAAVAVNDAINNTAVEGGVLADTFVVVDGTLSQRAINKGLESIADLSTIQNPNDGLRVYVKSYHVGLNKGGGYFTYDSSKADKYDGGWFFNGWVRDNVTERSVVDYGAIGNWDRTKIQGANDTEAFQRVLDSLKDAGALRDAGLRKIIVPSGHYMIDSITLRRENRWGVHIEGISGVSTLYFNENIEEEAAIISETESVSFSNLSLQGNLGGTWSPLDRQSYGFLGRKPIDDAQLDIDVSFDNCSLYGWNTFARIEGRGFVMNGGSVGGTLVLLNIHARDVVSIPYPEQVYNQLFSIEAGMRHYNIRNIRVDGCGRLISITSGTSEDAKKLANNINNIQVIGNDVQGMDAIIFTGNTECRIKNSVFSDNVFVASFSSVPFRFSSVENTVINGNTITPNSNLSVFELESEKHNQKYSMNAFITAKKIRNLIVSDNNVVGVGATIIGTTDGGVVESLTLSNNNFPEFGTSDIIATRRMLYVENPASLKNISLINNTLSSQAESNRLFEITNADRSKIIVDGNSSNFAFRDAYKYIVLSEVRSESTTFSYLNGNFIVRCWYTRGFDGYISGEVRIDKDASYSTSVDTHDLKIPTPSGVVSDKSNYTAMFSGSTNVFKSSINTKIFVDIVTSNGGCFEIKDATTGNVLKASEFITDLTGPYLSFTFRYLPS